MNDRFHFSCVRFGTDLLRSDQRGRALLILVCGLVSMCLGVGIAAASDNSSHVPEVTALSGVQVVSAAAGIKSERVGSLAESPKSEADPWKGKSGPADWSFGAQLGLGVLNSAPGFALVATGGYRILRDGFVPDINDSAFAELQMGPLFVSGTVALLFSAHLRWDFTRDEQWTFYGLGGLGGFAAPVSLGSASALYPRFGIGAIWKIHPIFGMRAEISHEMTTVGGVFTL